MEWRDEECAFLGSGGSWRSRARPDGRPTSCTSRRRGTRLSPRFPRRRHRRGAGQPPHPGGPGLLRHAERLRRDEPPIRGERHQAAAWAALRDGTVDTIGSDHAPHARAAKERPWPDCPAGLTGVQTLVPIMLDTWGRAPVAGAPRRPDGSGPARVYGLTGKGRIAAGYDADFTLVDLKARRRIEGIPDRLALRLDAVRGTASPAGRSPPSCAVTS